jgi:polyisoprenoid-binding protein YceI
MKYLAKTFVLSLLFAALTLAGDSRNKSEGTQTFSFKDQMGRNQATFFSTTPLEDITGMSSDVRGKVVLDLSDIKNTLKGEVSISTASLKSGIDLRDEHIRSKDWLDAENFPTISFKIKSVIDVKETENNKLDVKVLGEFTVRGITKEVISEVSIAYLEENEITKTRMPGDLLGVRANFNIKLSEYGVENMVVGNKVSEEIEISVNIVGSNNI